jgi:hypothetical protein
MEVKLRDAQGLLREVDARHPRAALRHRLREDAGPAADIEHRGAGELGMARDPFQAQRIDVVEQRNRLRDPCGDRQAELPVRRIDVHGH